MECPFTRYASRSWLQFHIIYGILIIWYYEFRVLSDPENLVRDTLGRVPKSKIGFGRYWTFPCTFKLSRQSVDQLRQENLYLVWLKECLVPSLKIKTVPGILRVPSHAVFMRPSQNVIKLIAVKCSIELRMWSSTANPMLSEFKGNNCEISLTPLR